MSKIMGNMVGAYSNLGKTIVIEDESGNELTGVITDQEVIFTADAEKDIREGKVAATDAGVVTGKKVIPSYHTHHGTRIIMANKNFTIPLDQLDCYDYTVLHCMICAYNTKLTDSVAVDRIVVYDTVYPVQSTEAIATVTKDDTTKSIVLGITNDTDTRYILRYITYKEID